VGVDVRNDIYIYIYTVRISGTRFYWYVLKCSQQPLRVGLPLVRHRLSRQQLAAGEVAGTAFLVSSCGAYSSHGQSRGRQLC
jgi:hypothetical protein